VIGPAPAKLNLALVVGPLAGNGKHELLTVYQRVDLCDRLTVEPASATVVEGFAEDTLVRRALDLLAAPHGWRVRIEKHIPVAAGLAGGSSDAATALRLANAQLDDPLPAEELHAVAASLGSDVPFFLTPGPQLGSADGSALAPLDLPQDFVVVLVLPTGSVKQSTAAVYEDFDRRGGAAGFEQRCAALRETLSRVRRARDLANLPANDLAASPLTDDLRAAGAFRADVTGAGPVVYGLFEDLAAAARAARRLRHLGRTWSTVPAWYG
jgi:4-diphosphocytidyl-2-C-methyl-D-erythritol kinase